MDGLTGVSVSDTSVADVTLSEAVPLTDPDLAVIVVDPTAAVVARPARLMVATLVAEDAQLAEDVRSWVLPSEYVPVALNWAVVPFAIDGLAGDTAIDTSAAGVTFKSVLPMIEFIVAVIVAVPTATPVTRPWLPTRLPTVATAADEEVQVTFLVKSFVVPSP
jgi:hypothetical protein